MQHSHITQQMDTLHVPFEYDENGNQNDSSENNGTIALNYSRDDLLRLRNTSMAKRPPKFADDETQIDDKRKEKIRMVVKMNGGGGGTNFSSTNKRVPLSTVTPGTDSKDKMPLNESLSLLPSFALGKYRKQNTADTVVGSPATIPAGKLKESKDTIVAIEEKLPSERERIGFQQLMASASGPGTVNPVVEQQHEPQTNNRRHRVGSGRISENLLSGGGLWANGYRHSGSGNDKDSAFNLNYGVDQRHSNNDFFDKRQPIAPIPAQFNGERNNKIEGERSEAYEWNKENNRFTQMSSRESSTEPEWVSCGPTSKHDIIELHGFDGPNGDAEDASKYKDAVEGNGNSPPARSTPAKGKKSNHDVSVKSDEHFNFEDFFKLDLPSGNPVAKGPGPNSGESRFTQWFRRDNPSKKNGPGFDAAGKVHGSSGQSFASSEQFIDLIHKTHGKKIESNLMASSAKFRSVEELEAELIAPAAAGHAQQMHRQRQEQTKAANDLIEFRKLLTQMEQQIILQQQQQQQQQQHKANIVQQLCLLQQMNNTSQSQRERERESLMALLNVCNDSFMPRFVPQHQQYQHQQPFMPNGNIGQSFRQFQANVGNGMSPHSPTQQELHFHTQAIMQNALLKKQYEDQYRKSQQNQKQHPHQRSSMTPSPQPLFHNNQNYGQPQFRNNKPKFNQLPKEGFQLMAPPQSKPIFGRYASQRAGHAKFQNQAPAAPVASPVAVDNTPVDVVPAVNSPAVSVIADK